MPYPLAALWHCQKTKQKRKNRKEDSACAISPVANSKFSFKWELYSNVYGVRASLDQCFAAGDRGRAVNHIRCSIIRCVTCVLHIRMGQILSEECTETAEPVFWYSPLWNQFLKMIVTPVSWNVGPLRMRQLSELVLYPWKQDLHLGFFSALLFTKLFTTFKVSHKTTKESVVKHQGICNIQALDLIKNLI